MLIHLATNPGQFTSPEGSDSFLSPCVLIAVAVWAVIAVVLLFIPKYRAELKNDAGVVITYVVGGLIVLAVAGAMCGTFLQLRADMSGTAVAEREYTTAVQGWLADDYGIQATAAETEQLLDGAELATDVAGTPTVIHIITAVGGDLTLVDSGDIVIAAAR